MSIKYSKYLKLQPRLDTKLIHNGFEKAAEFHTMDSYIVSFLGP